MERVSCPPFSERMLLWLQERLKEGQLKATPEDRAQTPAADPVMVVESDRNASIIASCKQGGTARKSSRP